jgi:F0F1-type ATP synthase membrane subunit b/b'
MPKFLLTVLVFFCLTFKMWSQPTQEQLEERKAKIQLEIQEKEQLLKSVKSQERTVVGQLIIQKETSIRLKSISSTRIWSS